MISLGAAAQAHPLRPNGQAGTSVMSSMATTAVAPSAAAPAPRHLRRWRLGTLTISLGPHPVCLPKAQGALLLIPLRQGLQIRDGNLPRLLRPPSDLLYLPGSDTELQVSPYEGWRLELDRDQLCLLAAELCRHRLSPGRFRQRLQQGRPLQLRQRPEQELCTSLLELLRLSDSRDPLLCEHLELVGLDRMILRLVTLLLCGDLIRDSAGVSDGPPGSRQQIVAALLSWIEAHLQQPLQLRDLVRHSGYSERRLRDFFQERFGCSPMQWIRRRRLQTARRRLLNPEPGDTVSTIAAAVGYSHASQFSRDFRNAFGCKPSTLLREGLRQHPQACRPASPA